MVLMFEKLERFLAKFPDNTTCWSQATDEIRDMYFWISRGGDRFPPVGRENCHTPSEWNTKYKKAIRECFAKLDAKTQGEFMQRFSTWLEV